MTIRPMSPVRWLACTVAAFLIVLAAGPSRAAEPVKAAKAVKAQPAAPAETKAEAKPDAAPDATMAEMMKLATPGAPHAALKVMEGR